MKTIIAALLLSFTSFVQASEMCDAQAKFAQEVVEYRKSGLTENEVIKKIHSFTEKRPNGAIETGYLEMIAFSVYALDDEYLPGAAKDIRDRCETREKSN